MTYETGSRACDVHVTAKPTHHVNHVLEVLLTDKMVINSIFLSKVGPPCGVTGSVKTDTHTKYRDTQYGVSSNISSHII